jgi:hypothetical protein
MNPRVFDMKGTERDMEWLQKTYQVTYLDAGNSHKFRLERIDESEGASVIQVYVRNWVGDAIAGMPVIMHYPDPSLPPVTSLSRWHPRGIALQTDTRGSVGFGLGKGSYYDPSKSPGPHTVWVGSERLPSDGLSGIGMLPGTNHRGPLVLFFREWIPENNNQEEPQVSWPPEIQVGMDVHETLQYMCRLLEEIAKRMGISVTTDCTDYTDCSVKSV